MKNLHGSKGTFVDTDCLKIGHDMAAVYEAEWYPSLILEINWDQGDLVCITLVMIKTASFGHPEMIYITCHSPILLD